MSRLFDKCNIREAYEDKYETTEELLTDEEIKQIKDNRKQACKLLLKYWDDLWD